jgi:Leucine-rich repeat (LRR) protein
MSGNSFDSSLPSELARLSQLQRLYIQDAALKGSLRDFVKEVASSSSTSQLVELWLDDNHLTGTIPSEIGALTNLASLSVSNNALTGTIPTTIANLRNMGT